MVDVGLGEPHVIFDQDITTGEHLAIRNPHVGRDNGAVVQVEGFNVEVGVNPGWWLTAAGGGFWAHNPRIKPPSDNRKKWWTIGCMTTDASACQLGVFDMFTLGIGPSSSHTVGPMRAGRHFADLLLAAGTEPSRVRVTLFGSLAATGIGHGTNRAVLLGLAGARPETVETDLVDQIIPRITQSGRLPLLGGASVPFTLPLDLRFEPRVTRTFHVNALTIDAWAGGLTDVDEAVAVSRTYYSTGGGFVVVDEDGEMVPVEVARVVADAGETVPPPFLPFLSGVELLDRCRETGACVADIMRTNEASRRPIAEVDDYLDLVVSAMFACVEEGCWSEGVLPGGLGVPRRAAALRAELQGGEDDPLAPLDWVTLYALAVNEENAAGHRVVTAPTNGAAGIIPAVLGHFVVTRAARLVGGMEQLAKDYDLARPNALLDAFPQLVPGARDFLLAATAVGSIIKTNASIAGAEVGCQGEVGSASAMAAAGLAQAMGGTPAQVENAAEIAMEHSLGLTCDPVGGLVQIPCIERNAIGAVKAISAARMALYGDWRHQVSLDAAIETMRQTGVDMHSKYKETSIGGLAVNVVEC